MLCFAIRQSTEFRDPLCLKSLYNCLVRSILEFSCVVWCLQTIGLCTKIKSVQRRLTRVAVRCLLWRGNFNVPIYPTRCLLLGLQFLEHRRKVAQSVFVAKLLKQEIDAPELLKTIPIYAWARTHRQRTFLQNEYMWTLASYNNPL